MKSHWIIFLLSASCAFGQETQHLTLEAALALGKTQNRVLQLSSARVDQEQSRAGEVNAALYPGLMFVGSYTRIQDGSFRLSTTNLPVPITVAGVVTDNYVMRVGLRQPLFTGFRLRNTVEAARLGAEAAELDRQMTADNVDLWITAAYWKLYQRREVETVADGNARRVQSYKDDTERLVQAGVRTRTDLLNVDVQLANAKIGLIEARNEAQLAEIELNNLLGQPAGTKVTLDSRPEDYQERYDEALLHDLASLEATASAYRFDLKAAATRVSAAEATVSAAEGRWWPQVELNASYMYNRPNSRYQPITPEFLGSWDVGVTVAFDIWNWGATVHNVEQAEAVYRQAQLREIQIKEEIVLEIHQAVLNALMTHEKLALANVAFERADKNLKDVTEKYRTGLMTSTELLDAEVAMLQAETQSSAASVEHALAIATLDRAIGKRVSDGTTPHE